MMTRATRLNKTLVELSDCLCETVAEKGAGPVCGCSLVPGGEAAWDTCSSCSDGSCGSAYVSVTGITPYETFGVPESLVRCTSAMQAVVKLGVVRCFSVDEDGSVDPDEMAEVALALNADAMAMLEAVRCCLSQDTVVVEYSALPASGGCVGGEWTIIVDMEA
jgi:hypothetical protein